MRYVGESVEDDFVDTINSIIDVQCSIEHNENHIRRFRMYDSDDMDHLYENRDILLQNAQRQLASIPDPEKPYAIGRGRQKVYDCDRAVTNYHALCKLLNIPQ